MWRWLFAAWCLGVLVAAPAAFAAWHAYSRALDAPLVGGGPALRFVVEHGTSVRALAAQLERAGVRIRPLWLRLAARARGVDGRIQAGEYELRPGMAIEDLLEALVAGRVVQHGFTIVEGWTFAELRAALARSTVLEHTLAGIDAETLMARLGKAGMHPEGWFLPETYHFVRGTTDLQLLRRAHTLMEKTLAQLWARRDPGLPYAGPYEALIMASIIEKETGLAAERPLIGGVLVRRLARGMRLQADPTVIYGLGADFDGDLRRRDLRADSPYNTYRQRGLPPTPIALPGADALRAALQPAPGEALYFVARGDGSHVFSSSLEEHNRAVARYQLGAGQ